MDNEQNSRRLLDRRKFLAGLAIGAGAAPLWAISRSAGAAAGKDAAAAVCYSNKRTLTPDDIRYLGALRVPSQGPDLTFSYGSLTGRRVNGETRLLMVGNLIAGDPVFEFADPGGYQADENLAPRIPLVRAWGDIYGSARKTWHKDGTEKVGYPRYPGGIHWNESKQLLYWVFYDTYNTTGDEDWCLGASELAPSGPRAFGPWRPSGEGRKGPWRCLRLGEHPSGEMLCGSGVMSGSSNSPWGPDLWAGNFPGPSTPAGFGTPDLQIQKYLTYYPMVGSIGLDGRYTGPLKSCRRPGDYIFEPIKGGGAMTEIDPTKYGGQGSWTQVDGLSGMVWIDLPSAHGVIFTGRLAAGHVWYRNAGVGNDLCTHGVASPLEITGPICTDAYPTMIIYNPEELAEVRLGRRTDYSVDPMHIVNAQSRYKLTTAAVRQVGSGKMLGGAYFDRTTQKLYVAAPESDTTIAGIFNPLVHVFQIG